VCILWGIGTVFGSGEDFSIPFVYAVQADAEELVNNEWIK